MTRFVYLLSHDEVNQGLACDLGAQRGLSVQVRSLREGLPDGDCQALIVDLDGVAPDHRALNKLVKELSSRHHGYPVMAFGYNLKDNQVHDLRAAGIQVFRHGPQLEMFAAISVTEPQG